MIRAGDAAGGRARARAARRPRAAGGRRAAGRSGAELSADDGLRGEPQPQGAQPLRARRRAASRFAAATFAGEKAPAGMSGATAVEPVTMKGPTCTVSVHLPWSFVRRWNHQLPGASAGLVTPRAVPGRSRMASGSDRGAFVQLTE